MSQQPSTIRQQIDSANPTLLNTPQHQDYTQQHQDYTHGYDSAMTVKMHAQRTLEKQGRFFLPYLQAGMTVLDGGCGAGSITLGLAKAVAPGQVTGIDRAAPEIERARANAAHPMVNNVHFEVGNLYELTFVDASFDAVFCHNVLEHLNDPLKALGEMWRVLKPGGVIGVRDANNDGNLVLPPEELLLEWFTLLKVDWRAQSGDPELAKRLPALLRQANFQAIRPLASYDLYSARQEIQMVAEVGSSRCHEPDFVQRVLHNKLADLPKLDQLHDAWLAWAKHPDAFFAHAHVEVVGRKP